MVVHDLIKMKIKDGTYPVSEFLPTEPELEKIYQVSRTTVRTAMEILKEEGLVEIRQGRGTIVLDSRAIQSLNKVTSVTECLRKRGFDVRTKSMYIDIIYATEKLGKELHQALGTPIARIQRIQLINEKPIAIIKDYIPYSLVPNIEQFTNMFNGLYEFLEQQYHLEIQSAADKIFAKSADFAESEMLLCRRELLFCAYRESATGITNRSCPMISVSWATSMSFPSPPAAVTNKIRMVLPVSFIPALQ